MYIKINVQEKEVEKVCVGIPHGAVKVEVEKRIKIGNDMKKRS